MDNGKMIFLGGDRRERVVMGELVAAGHQVAAWAWPAAALPEGVTLLSDLAAGLKQARAVILPLPPLQEDGRLYSLLTEKVYLPPRALAGLAPHTPLLVGINTPRLQRLAAHCRIIPMLEREDIARPLAEAAAEGALAEAIRLSGGLLFGEKPWSSAMAASAAPWLGGCWPWVCTPPSSIAATSAPSGPAPTAYRWPTGRS